MESKRPRPRPGVSLRAVGAAGSTRSAGTPLSAAATRSGETAPCGTPGVIVRDTSSPAIGASVAKAQTAL